MTVETCSLEGIKIITPTVLGDERGWICETWNAQTFGIDANFVRDVRSFSVRYTLRGLHFQKPFPQAKLITVLKGIIIDVVVDLRKSSPTFKKSETFCLNGTIKAVLFVPEGFAHGFLTLSDSAVIHYKLTDQYYKDHEHRIRWNDPDLAVPWPIKYPIISEPDASAPLFRDTHPGHLFP